MSSYFPRFGVLALQTSVEPNPKFLRTSRFNSYGANISGSVGERRTRYNLGLMTEVSATGEDHGEAILVARIDYFLIAF